ncbi:hypothetical protein QBC35DRAFT_385363 [Podospora australis]|uniref:Uncharacterized protein n=1 Tax=Podospora australis TaxID=1536484 RepID=A0AAN6WTP8_9PEZI|nr:hypothetical protein QBC35DRAFT_385363 [Podospora australis]
MRSGGVSPYNSVVALLFATASWPHLTAALPSRETASQLLRRKIDVEKVPLWLDLWSPDPSPEDGPPLSAGAIRDPAYLPAQIGGIVGAYALSLVVVALLLLALLRRRRERIRNRDLPEEERGLLAFNPFPPGFASEEEYKKQLQQFEWEQQYGQPYPQQEQDQLHPGVQKLSLQTHNLPQHGRNFSLPTASPLSPNRFGPLSATKSQHSLFTVDSPTSTILACGIDLSVDQTIVGRDRVMAQNQLEEMYRHVMEQEAAKAEGRPYEPPQVTSPSMKSVNTLPPTPGTSKRERNKPSNLNLARDEKAQSRGSSILSFLKSPRKNKVQGGMVISSPIMTPMSGTFPRHDEQEMNPIPPRHYAPPAPPPVPAAVHDLPLRRGTAASASATHLPSPDISPVSTQSIDSRIGNNTTLSRPPTSRREQPTTAADQEPVSATTSEAGSVGHVGLPLSPKPGANRFPSFDSLPVSPRPGQTSFPKSATAVRAGGALPFRAYEPSGIVSPTSGSFAPSTKQTVFTRAEGPLSPGMPTGMRTPWTGAPVPYTPYQPFSPVVPITPSVVTRADRKRMKRLEPKTPTVEMVKDADEYW